MKELLFSINKKDLKIDYFSGTGAGGQYRNKHQNCVRIHHNESGAISTGQSQRDRKSNIREALYNLIKNPKFRMWNNMKIQEIETGLSMEKRIEEMISPENLLVECKDENNRWTLTK